MDKKGVSEVTDKKAKELIDKTFEFIYNEIDNLDINQSAKMIYFYSVAKALYVISEKVLKDSGVVLEK